MAKLYLLRLGSGDNRVASSFSVEPEKVKEVYEGSSVIVSGGIPVFNGDAPANPVSNPEVAVIELFEGEKSFGEFKSPGFNILSGVNASDAYKCLIESKNT